MLPLRTFIAFDSPKPVREELSKLQLQLRKSNADVRWESPEKFHATIKFLGDVQEGNLPNILSKIQSVVQIYSQFEIVFKNLGCFPHRKNPRVIWVGCENADGELEVMKTQLDIELLPLGFEVENRPFHPHITLGRVKSPRGLKNLTSILESLTFQPQNAVIKEILTMKSVLKREGSEYSVLKSLQLKTS